MKQVEKVVTRHLIAAIGKKNQSKIHDEAYFLEDLGMNSMLLISFFTNVIEELGISIIEFSDDELTNVRSVIDLKKILETKINK